MADTEVYLTPEEKLSSLGTLLMQSVLSHTENGKLNRRSLFGHLNPKIFRNEDYVLFDVLYNFKDKGVVPDAEFLKMYLLRNTKRLQESAEYIDLTAYADLDENPLVGYASAVLKHYNRIKQLPELEPEEFNLTIEKYKVEYSACEMAKAYTGARSILHDGEQHGRKFLQGYEDSVAYVKNKMAFIESLLDQTTGAGFIDSRTEGIIDKKEAKPTKIGDFGLIKELNEGLGGYYTSVFYSILAPTKGGKSKFTSRAIHNIVVENGHNVSVWAHEGGYEAWWAQLRAIHYEYLYIRNAEDGTRVVPVSQGDIMKNTFPSDEVRELEAASRLDLFTNEAYGNIYMIDRPFYAESFIDEVETSVQLNNSKAVLIDYLQLITSRDPKAAKSQTIGKAYQALLAYCKKRNVMAISPSQFTQETMSEMAKTGGKGKELRTAGGESSEVVRTPDVNIALYATTEDLARREMTIKSMPSRLAEPFPDIKIYADLCSCVFASMDEE